MRLRKGPPVAAGISSALRMWRGAGRRLLFRGEAGLPEAAVIAQAGVLSIAYEVMLTRD
jgi:hypothetical protein